MGSKRVSGPPGRNRGRGHRKKAPAGLRVEERDGHWHVVGTVRVKGRSIRVRRSTGLPAEAEFQDDAATIADDKAREIRQEVIYGIRPTAIVSVAAHEYLTAPRKRDLGKTTVMHIQKIAARFSDRKLRQIPDKDWNDFINLRNAGNKPETRERWLNSLMGFLNWCRIEPRQYIDRLPAFDRDKEARNPHTSSKRRVGDLTPRLVALMVENASWHLRPQLAVEWSTGGRVSSVLHGCQLCDVILAEGREQITFHDTKNGRTVDAALHPWAAEEVRRYLERRGLLHWREGPLFLTHRNEPYSENSDGAQNRTAFNAMKRRTARSIRSRAAAQARTQRRQGDRAGAWQTMMTAREEADLVLQVTQHWFRHMLADGMLKRGADDRSTMAQGGWIDVRSVMRYTRDVKAHRRALITAMDTPSADTSLTRAPATKPKEA